MKKAIFTLIIILSGFNHAKSQEPYPQLWFYSNTSPVSEKSKNEVKEHDNLNWEIFRGKYFNRYNDKQMIDMLYRVYEIEQTSEIKYSTSDWKELLLKTEEPGSEGAKVDFGAALLKNEETDTKGEYKLRFGSPVKIIDPSIFSNKVMSIVFPQNANMIYESSADIRVDRLSYMDGPCVIKNTWLIDQNSTLIVAATHNRECMKIPEGVVGVGAGAFRGSGISSIIIPASVKNIGENAFDNTKLSHIFINCEEMPSFNMNVFGSSGNSNMRLYVHQKILNDYKRTFPSFSKQILSMEKNHGALLYAEGLRMLDEKAYFEALSFFEEAGQFGSVEANYQLGEMYLGAKGVERDAKVAYTYFEKAAKKKHVESMFMCYNYPRYWCHPADLKTATKWLKKAIKYDHRASAFQLGHIYSDADHNGFPLKLKDALDAYKKAYEISNGDTYAEKNIRRVEKLIEFNVDKILTFNNVDARRYVLNDSAQYLYDKLHNEKSFCLFDMVIALMKEYDVKEETALRDCKELVEKWENLGLISIK